jgi:YbbR domain-containing protein
MNKTTKSSKFNFLANPKDHWSLRAVSLFIAVILWITVLGGKRIEVTKTVSLDFQLPADLVIANSVPKEITFRIIGPRAFVKEYQDRNMTIPVDLKNAKVGETEFFVKESTLDLPLGLKVSSISQSLIPIRIDRVAIKRVPVRPNISANFSEGFKVKNVTLKPSTVEIRGARSRVNIIEALPTEPITLLSGSMNQELLSVLDLRDYSGIQIADTDKTITVSVELEGELSRKWIRSIPVEVRIRTAQVSESVDVKSLGVRVKPSKVNLLIEGPESKLGDLDEKEIQVWAEIPQLKGGNYASKLVWKLAPDLRVVKRSTDTVEVTVPGILSK